ncbi:MAG: hypothetical protein ABIH27_01535 [Candidatus Omnitrophota bacterium]
MEEQSHGTSSPDKIYGLSSALSGSEASQFTWLPKAVGFRFFYYY